MSTYKTKQEEFWAGEFGNEYINRNNDATIIAGNLHLFSQIVRRTQNVNSMIEFGSNIGLNLIAIKKLLPQINDFSAIEINHEAAVILKENPFMKNVYEQSVLDFKVDYQRDFVLVKGVLIHQNPEVLDNFYELLYQTSRKYICIAEYYNPTPEEIPYRGHEGKLFKRDFAGEMLDKYQNLHLVDYGFSYRRDPNFPQDDITWFLLEK